MCLSTQTCRNSPFVCVYVCVSFFSFFHSEYYHYRQAWIPLRWLPAEAVFEDDYSTKTDVWSFGVLMWEVFSLGEMPHAVLADDKVLEGERGGHGCAFLLQMDLGVTQGRLGFDMNVYYASFYVNCIS